MRKVMLLAVALCVGLGWAVRGGAQEDEARAVLAKALKAHGGEDKLVKLKAAQSKGKGTISLMGNDHPLTMENYVQMPDKIKVVLQLEVNNMNVTITQVFNGDKGWANIGGNTVELDKEQMKQVKNEMYVQGVTSLIGLKDKDYKLFHMGEFKVKDRAAVGVRVTKKDQPDVSLYFDKATHLLVKAEYRALDPNTMQEGNQEKYYSEFKDLGTGLQSPTKIVIHNDGKKFLELEVTEVRIVDRHDDSIFAKP